MPRVAQSTIGSIVNFFRTADLPVMNIAFELVRDEVRGRNAKSDAAKKRAKKADAPAAEADAPAPVARKNAAKGKKGKTRKARAPKAVAPQPVAEAVATEEPAGGGTSLDELEGELAGAGAR